MFGDQALWESLSYSPRFGGKSVRPHTLTPKSGDPPQKFLKSRRSEALGFPEEIPQIGV
jgi:hypothetical protein